MKNNGAARPGDGRKFLWKKNILEKAVTETKDLPLVFGRPGRGMNFRLKEAIIDTVIQGEGIISIEDAAEVESEAAVELIRAI